MIMNYNKLPKENGKYIKLAEPKMCYEELTNTYKCETKVMVQICDTIEKNIINTVVNYAKENNATDLILIDEDFVKSALKHEQKLRSPVHQVKSVKKPPTNFDKITQSVENLAYFISTLSRICDNTRCDVCPLIAVAECDNEERIKEWLQQEADNENK